MKVRVEYTLDLSESDIDAIAFAIGRQSATNYEAKKFLRAQGEVGLMKQRTLQREIKQWIYTHPKLKEVWK